MNTQLDHPAIAALHVWHTNHNSLLKSITAETRFNGTEMQPEISVSGIKDKAEASNVVRVKKKEPK